MRHPRVGIVAMLVLAACSAANQLGTVPTSTPTPATTTSVVLSSSPPSTEGVVTTTTTFLPVNTALIVIGDWGSGTLPQGAVAGAAARYAEEKEIEAILTTGDNFYSDDSVFLMRPYGWVQELGIPWWVVWGNHDVESESRIDAVNEVFDDPLRWTVHTWGQVEILILDSNQVTSLRQAAFFLQSMAASNRPMIIALHHPPYSCSHQGSTVDVVNEMVGLFDEDVVLVLAGHDHNYQRFENAGVAYVVSGGGGRGLYELNDCPDNHPERLAGAELHHFLALTQTSTSIEMEVIDTNGDVIEEVTIAFR